MKNKLKIACACSLALITLSVAPAPVAQAASTVTIKQDVKASKKKHKKQSKTKRVNKALKKALKEDQGFAEGKLDASGNPTDNGTPNSEYDFATYVSSLKYQSNSAVKVQMNGKVQDVTLVEMDTIANKVQGLVDSTLMVENVIKPEDVSKGTYLRFFYGQRALGHSNLSDHTKFKWYTD